MLPALFLSAKCDTLKSIDASFSLDTIIIKNQSDDSAESKHCMSRINALILPTIS